MRYVITESKLNGAIIEYLNELYDVTDINWVNPYQYDDETGEEWEDNNIIDFYKGDYDGPYDSNFLFRWYDPQYYSERGPVELYEIAPIIEVYDEQGKTLNSYFGDRWKEPFKIWFKENFQLPIKTVKVGIS
jgi:hypothetical protein